MTLWRADPESAADALILERLDLLDLPQGQASALLYANCSARLVGALEMRGHEGVVWLRRWRDGSAGGAAMSSCAPDVSMPYRVALLRLPKDKRELVFNAALVFEQMTRDGRLIVYGGNDEGVRSAAKRLSDQFGVVAETLSTHGHGRILSLGRPTQLPDREAWRVETDLDVIADGRVTSCVSYPGVFGGHGIDKGTALLLRHLPDLRSGAKVLDYGCGTGVLALALRKKTEDVSLTLIDIDQWALVAARANVASTVARFIAADRISVDALQGDRFDLIISNPPIHDGIREDHGALQRLITDASARLLKDGRLLIVVQRRIAIEPMLKAHFKSVAIDADDGSFRVWSAALT